MDRRTIHSLVKIARVDFVEGGKPDYQESVSRITLSRLGGLTGVGYRSWRKCAVFHAGSSSSILIESKVCFNFSLICLALPS